MAPPTPKADQNELEKKCRLLEGRCRDYVQELKQTNRRLETEIEKQKAIEGKLQESELRFRKIFEYAPFGAAMTDPKGNVILANRALCNMLEYDREEMESLHVADITHEADIDTDMAMFRKITAGRLDHYRLEKRYRTKSGKTLWGSMAATVVPGQTPEGAAIIGMVEDITQRKVAEEAIIQSRDELESIVSARTREIRRLKDRLQAENQILKQELADSQSYGDIVGKSFPIKTVIAQIELVAPTDANVLIHGESGTGKELVAREIHRHSQRKAAPMIKVNCATIPKDLYESEFFGHVKGAFTGALRDRIGRFEAADGGTIFLDEVGEIPLDLQSKLLRILQEGEYERLGEEKTKRVDVRIIAATNRNLAAEVKASRFRDDLFYRLNVFPIQIAPLQDRKEDIQSLATHLIQKLSRKLNVSPPKLTQANLMDLHAYHWPGNVRELENVIERSIILNRSNTLNFSSFAELSLADAPSSLRPAIPDAGRPVLTEEELKRFERQNIINALAHCKGKIYGEKGSAGLLGIKPTTLIERMKRMRIQKPAKA
ncbi:MAG: sigma 54-interacting transcriptional regulator [Desulfobacterales bacterium]